MKQYSSVRFAGASSAGFTIIEVLIALAIFSIGLMAVSALQTASLMSVGSASQKTKAWAILDDQADTLKSMPFYANHNGIDDDGDGQTDELLEEMPELVGSNNTGVSHSENRMDGKYTVTWVVVNNQPVNDPVTHQGIQVPPRAGYSDYPVLTGVPAGTYVVSKTINISVTLNGHPRAGTLASASFVRTWAEDGIP